MPSSSRITLRRSTALTWRTLRSMRTALILLLMLALASVAGSLVPQWPNSPERVVRFQLDHPLVGAFYGRAGLFDVYGSWWFVLITALLFISLVACLVPRSRALVRTLRQRPIQAREIDAFRLYEERTVSGDPARVIAGSRRVLRRRMFRVARDDGRPALAAEKGALREVGSLLFHWAFLLIVIGVIYGKGTGFTGRAVVIEGKTWIDAQANYDGQLRTGRFFNGDFTGAGIHLRGFEDTYRLSGQAMDFVSHVDLLDQQGNVARQADIRVNDPASIDGIEFFQYGFGWAPVVEIRQRDGELLASEPITFVQDTAPEGVPQLAMPWRGILKLSSLRPQVGLTLVLWPDSRAWLQLRTTGEPVAMTQEFQPLMFYKVYRGELTDPSLTLLDTSVMRQAGRGVVGAGQSVDLRTGKALAEGASPSGLTISFPELRQYSVLQVSRDRGVPLVLLAAILVLLGLLPALYTSRRKVWVRAEPKGNGTVLKVGGFALQRKPQFDEEFPKLVEALARAAGDAAVVEEKERVSSR